MIKIFLLMLLASQGFFLNAQNYTQTIRGRVMDGDSKIPIIGANVVILNTMLGAATDTEGSFVIVDVPVGSYNLSYSYIGYKTRTESDIIVRPGRSTNRASSPTNRNESARLRVSEWFPRAPCNVLKSNKTASPGSISHSST